MAVVLTPEELLSQAGEMERLMGQYEALFNSVSATLNQVNQDWSENLSRNFTSKIASAQKNFSTVLSSLEFGATAARKSAESFSNIDQQLAKSLGGNGSIGTMATVSATGVSGGTLYDHQGGNDNSLFQNQAIHSGLTSLGVGTVATSGSSLLAKLLSNEAKASGSIHSWNTPVGTMSLGSYSAKVENSAEWDIKKGNSGVNAKASASASVWQVRNAGQSGVFGGGYDVKVGTAKAEGKASLNIMSSGKLDPKLELQAKGELHGIDGEVNGSVGNDQFNIHGKGEGTIGKAKAEAKIAIGKDGIGAKAEAGVAAVSGKATVGFNIFGIKIDASVKGEAGAIGAGAEFGVTDSSFEIGGKLSFIAGLGLKIKISW